MRRAGVFLGLAMLSALAAQADDAPAPANPAPGDVAPAEEAAAAEEIAWRTRRPEVSLLVVGGQLGEIRPTRAVQPPEGGLERLASLVDRLRYRPRDAAAGFGAVSLGWSMAGRGEEQEEAKADLYRAVLREMGFTGLLLGVPDLPVAAMRQSFDGGEGGTTSAGGMSAGGLSGIDAPCPPLNVLLPNAAPTLSFVDVKVGALPVRALTLVDPETAQRLVSGGTARASISVAMAVQGLPPSPDALWVVGAWLSGTQMEELRAGLRRLGPAVVVDLANGNARDVISARLGAEPLVVGLPTLGRAAGVLDLDRGEDGAWIASWRAVRLGPEIDAWESPLRDRVRGTYLAAYRALVRERGMLRRFADTYADPGGLRYLGSASCARCHPGIYEDWANTRHARALSTLKAVGEQHDPECVRCHVVGFERLQDGRWTRTASAFLDPDRTQHLGGVGCEGCHGPGSGHAAAPSDRTLWEPGRPNRRAPGLEGCAVCHDAENSPDFRSAYTTLLPRVDHRSVPTDRRTVLLQGGPARGR